MRNLFLSVIAAIFIGCSNVPSEPISKVTVSQGELQGTVENGLGVFKAIPYAEPPIGDLRWKAPVPRKSWEGVYKTDSFASKPPQPGSLRNWNEDCLYLSVMTPAHSHHENLPVMVWIHGGAFLGGSYAYEQGWKLAEQGVIAVSIEYRHGALGFLAHPDLSAESPDGISGNYGLQDQILALKWVKDNIKAFGGNPDNVTIFGESAGAISVSMLCASPAAKGLFRRAISESGGSFWPASDNRTRNTLSTLAGAEEAGRRFLETMGVNSIAELRKLDPSAWLDDNRTNHMEYFWPCVDGVIIAGDQYELYEEGRFNDVDIMVGTNSDEGSMFSRPTEVEKYRQEIKDLFGPFADRILEAYPAATTEDTFCAYADLFRETAFAWHSYAWEILQGKKSDKGIYVYYFDIPTQATWLPGPSRGAMHAAEIKYVFGTVLDREHTDNEANISRMMTRYWTSFAKTGNPNGEGLPDWPLFNPDGKTVMSFNPDGTSLISVPNLDKILLLEEFYAWKRASLSTNPNK